MFFPFEDLPDQIDAGLAGLPGVCHQLLRVVDGGDTVHLSVQNPNWTPAQAELLNEIYYLHKKLPTVLYFFFTKFFKILLIYISKRFVHVVLTINVPVVYMGRYKVVLRGDYP